MRKSVSVEKIMQACKENAELYKKCIENGRTERALYLASMVDGMMKILGFAIEAPCGTDEWYDEFDRIDVEIWGDLA